MRNYSTSDVLYKLKNKKVGVLFGGPSDERNVSIISGNAVIHALHALGVNVCGIDVDRNIVTKIKKEKIDIAYIALHGLIGEDGTIQGMLRMMGIPYTGCGVFASSLSMDKNLSKIFFKYFGILTPKWKILKRFSTFPKIKRYPVIVKPSMGGSTIDVTIVKNRMYLSKAIKKAFRSEYTEEIIIEQFIKGKEITVGVLYGKALPVIEIIPKYGFYDFKCKYQKNGSKYVIPARINKETYEVSQLYAEKIYDRFKCSAVCRVDMIVDENNKVWVLENNTIPGMTKTSLLPSASKEAGYNFENLVLEILKSALIK
ncbi:MAG: D-alanine--D-alanine ligase [Endomicrobium sp.]|jgi:D-alanine-D-alanine ligase|nr:D-alanine--D-alanine ligase [Endomicrobium sp.]